MLERLKTPMLGFVNRISPELKLGYLFAVVIALFLLPYPTTIAILLVVQAVLWVGSSLGWAPLRRVALRLVIFFLVIGASFAFVSIGDPDADRWTDLALGPWTVEVNLAGLAVALMMCMRVMLLVVASAWVQQSGKPEDFVRALERFHVPQFLAASIGGTLQLVVGSGGRGGGAKEAMRIGFKQIRRGKLTFVIDMVENALARAESFVAKANPGLASEQAKDIAIIVGCATAIMAVKVIHILPGLPFAPGHKNLVMVPLFLLAAGLTHARLGGLWTGLTVGIVSMMMGYGKYGVLGIAHFAVPGLLADLLFPLVRHESSRWLRLVQYAAIGCLLGLGRFAANFLVIVLAGAPGVAFMLYFPMLISQMVFGAVSAFVSLVVLELVARRAGGRAAGATARETGHGRGDKGHVTEPPHGGVGGDDHHSVLQAKQEVSK